MTSDRIPIGSKVYGRTGTQFSRAAGEVRGNTAPCQLEGCRGTRLHVRWPDGHVTKPCTKGLVYDTRRKAWRIG